MDEMRISLRGLKFCEEFAKYGLILRICSFCVKIRLNVGLKSSYAKFQLNIFRHTQAIKDEHNQQSSVCIFYFLQ